MKHSRGINSRPSIIGRIAFLAVFLVISPLAQAVPPLWEPNYNVAATELNGSAGGATGALPPSGSFGGRENIALGFNFPFGGNNYSHIVVDSDGSILLTNSAADTTNVLSTIWKKDIFEPRFSNIGGGSVKPLLLPFGTFTNQVNTGGKTYFKSIPGLFNGFTGNRAVVTWENSSIEGSATSDITFQAQLFDDGTIVYSYQVLSSTSDWNTRATQGIVIGVSNGDGSTPLGSSDFSSGDTGIDLLGYEIWCRNDDPNNPADCMQAGLGTNNAFDLHDKSIVFNPDGADGFLVSQIIEDGSGSGGSGVCEVSTEDAPAVGLLWDDSYDVSATELDGTAGGATGALPPSGSFGGRENIALGFNFPFGGVNYSHIVVDSDGSILLTNSAVDTSNVLATIWKADVFQPGFTNYGAGSVQPILLPFGSFTNQTNTGGKTWFKFANDTFAGVTGNRAIVTWENSSLEGTSTPDIHFQANLLADGTIIFSYKTLSNISTWDTRATQGIVIGVSNGDGAFPMGSQNFSTYDFGIDLTGYEVWCRNDDPANPANCVQAGLGKNDAFDLDDRSIVFNPDGATGFLVSQTVKNGSGNGGSGVCAEPPPPAAPVAGDDFITVTEDVNFNSVNNSADNLIDNDTDANGDSLRIVQGTFATVQGGEITINNNNGRYVYRPAQNFFGNDSYDYTVIETKPGGLSDVGTLFITVDPVNDPPIANNDSIEAIPGTVFNSVVSLGANDVFIDGPSFFIIAETLPTAQGGEITIASNGSFTYTPPASFSGSDNVNYTLTDGLLIDTARLDIVVTTEALDTLKSVLKSVKKLLKNKAIKNHGKSKKFMKKAKSHLEKAIDFLEMADDVNAEAQITGAIADLRKVKKKKSNVKKLITDLENIPAP